MKPGYYENILRGSTLAEIWRMGHPLLFPVLWFLVKFRRPGGRNFTYLPHVSRDSACAREQIPPALRERLDPLVAAAAQLGFTVRFWTDFHHGVYTQYQHRIAGVDLCDGETLLRFLNIQGHSVKGNNVLVDRLVMGATSFQGQDGAVIHTTTLGTGSPAIPRSQSLM